MIGFMIKDFLVMKKQFAYYLFMFVIYAAVSVKGAMPFSTTMGTMVILVGMLAPMSAFSYDEQAKWEKFAAVTPAGREGIVGGRYLFALAVLGLNTAVCVAFSLALIPTGLLKADLAETLFAVFACTGTDVLMDALYFPLLFKFGNEKGRLVAILIAGGTAAAVAFMALTGKRALGVPEIGGIIAAAALPLAAIAGLAVSWKASLGIVRKKEF